MGSTPIDDDTAVIVLPAPGITSSTPARGRFYALHAPPEHRDDTVRRTRSDAVQQVPAPHLRPTNLWMAALSGVSLSQ